MLTKPTNDVHVKSLRPLVPPAILIEEIPLDKAQATAVQCHRAAIGDVVLGNDHRLVAVVGPCSIHETSAALEYAGRLQRLAARLEDDILVVMRVYFEKPRTTVGWKGLINDPHLDGSFAINEGLRIARKLLRDIVDLGLPAGCEFLDPISPQFMTDLVAWGAIGARTTESQVHRELASGLSMPVGFKNGTDGNVKVAVEGVISARHPHRFLGVTEQGLAAIVSTMGNAHGHVILRGGDKGPNYHANAVEVAAEALKKADLPPHLMVDASHGNSNKDFRQQSVVIDALVGQIVEGSRIIMGVMMESFLVEGRQDLQARQALVHGQSITDACIGWATTEQVLEKLARGVATRARRKRSPGQK